VDLFDTTLVGLQRAMAGASLRGQVLANNIANANTPGFHRSDVDFHSVLASALGQGATPASVRRAGFSVATDSGGVMREDGSNVDIDREMSQLSQNTLEYQALVSVASARVGILKTAIGGS
jgi:flagellar basal-body rod protein FlgB